MLNDSFDSWRFFKENVKRKGVTLSHTHDGTLTTGQPQMNTSPPFRIPPIAHNSLPLSNPFLRCALFAFRDLHPVRMKEVKAACSFADHAHFTERIRCSFLRWETSLLRSTTYPFISLPSSLSQSTAASTWKKIRIW